jgi:hypothetical protein
MKKDFIILGIHDRYNAGAALIKMDPLFQLYWY